MQVAVNVVVMIQITVVVPYQPEYQNVDSVQSQALWLPIQTSISIVLSLPGILPGFSHVQLTAITQATVISGRKRRQSEGGDGGSIISFETIFNMMKTIEAIESNAENNADMTVEEFIADPGALVSKTMKASQAKIDEALIDNDGKIFEILLVETDGEYHANGDVAEGIFENICRTLQCAPNEFYHFDG